MRKAIVTAADTSHALSLERLCNQCTELLPEFKVYVFDLGLTKDDLKLINPKATVIKYDYDNLPDWHNIKIEAGEYAWKPICIKEISSKTDLLFWMDAGCLLKNNMEREIKHIQEFDFYTSSTRGTLEEYTDPRTLDLMNVPIELRKSHGMRAASLLGFDVSIKEIWELIDDWSRLAINKDVFAPDGSSKHPKIKGDTNPQFNHRQDQSVFNALLALNKFTAIGQRWGWVLQQDIDKRPRNIK